MLMLNMWLFALLISLAPILGDQELPTTNVELGGQLEKRLLDDLFSGYNSLVRPSVSGPINVTLGLDLQQIVEIDEKNHVITSNIWMKYLWTDVHLQWAPKEYGNIREVRIPISGIWKPDIMLYNSADYSLVSPYVPDAIVYSDGSISWITPVIITSLCEINTQWFPFDNQACPLKFGSWTYSGFKINLLKGLGETATYTTNGEWDLIGVNAVRNVMKYECCPEPYIDVTFTIRVHRRSLHYALHIILPCFLISALAIFAFLLPPESGERLTLVVVVFLWLCVTMLMVAGALPHTSDAIPCISVYFLSLIVMVAFAICSTIAVLNWHHRSPKTHNMSNAFRRIFVIGLPRLLCMGPALPMPMPRRPHPRTDVLDPSEPRDAKLGQADMDEKGLSSIVSELRRMTAKMDKMEEEAAFVGEWQLAAKVLGRASLIICTAILVLSTAVFISLAPHHNST